MEGFIAQKRAMENHTSTPAKRTGRPSRASRPDAPYCGAKNKVAPVGMTVTVGGQDARAFGPFEAQGKQECLCY